MERPSLNRNVARAVYLGLAVLALANGGCLLAAAGAVAGGAAGYAYYKGKVCRSYNADFGSTWAAVHTALAELNMPVEKEEADAASGSIHSRAGDGDAIRLQFDSLASAIPGEPPLTRVCVRVATFGDQELSERLLYQVGAHLVPGTGVPPPPPGSGPLRPIPAAARPSTTEPPLAN